MWRRMIAGQSVVMEFENDEDRDEEEIFEQEGLQYHENVFPLYENENV
jgi:hypothetical protein